MGPSVLDDNERVLCWSRLNLAGYYLSFWKWLPPVFKNCALFAHIFQSSQSCFICTYLYERCSQQSAKPDSICFDNSGCPWLLTFSALFVSLKLPSWRKSGPFASGLALTSLESWNIANNMQMWKYAGNHSQNTKTVQRRPLYIYVWELPSCYRKSLV